MPERVPGVVCGRLERLGHVRATCERLAGNNGAASSNLIDLTLSSPVQAAGVRLGIPPRHTGGDGLARLTLTQTTGGS
ncbi:MAG: hypothetical protein ACFCVE_05700, partial [Phycisphaerae bacterium]